MEIKDNKNLQKFIKIIYEVSAMKRCMFGKRLMAVSMTTAMLLGQCVSTMGSIFFEDEENVYVYFSNGCYEVVTDVATGATAEIEAGIGDSAYATVKFSPDGNYMYYITGYNAGVADLWRCEYRKLKAGATGNESYCQFIASNVSYASFEVTNKGVVFEDDSDNLYYFDGNTVRDLGQDINEFWCSEDGTKIAFECGDDPGSYVGNEKYTYLDPTQILYGVETSNPEKVIVLANEYLEVFDITDFDNIFFTRESDDEDQPYIYVTDFADGPRRLGTAAMDMTKCENDTVYYTRESEKDWNVDELFVDSRGETEELSEMKENFMEAKENGQITDLYMYKNGQEKKLDILAIPVYLGKTVCYQTLRPLLPWDIGMDDDSQYQILREKAYYWSSPYCDEIIHFDAYGQFPPFNMPLYINTNDKLLDVAGDLVRLTIVDEKIVSSSDIAQNATVLAMDENAIYYKVEKEDTDYCDIYKLANGNSTCIAQNVEFGMIYLYSDGSTTAFSYNNSLILTDENGNCQEIASDVSDYVRVDESTVLYVSDYNAWIWQNGESRLLGTNGERVWCSNPLEKVHYLGYTYSLH